MSILISGWSNFYVLNKRLRADVRNGRGEQGKMNGKVCKTYRNCLENMFYNIKR